MHAIFPQHVFNSTEYLLVMLWVSRPEQAICCQNGNGNIWKDMRWFSVWFQCLSFISRPTTELRKESFRVWYTMYRISIKMPEPKDRNQLSTTTCPDRLLTFVLYHDFGTTSLLWDCSIPIEVSLDERKCDCWRKTEDTIPTWVNIPRP
jgi:hypothetical protein